MRPHLRLALLFVAASTAIMATHTAWSTPVSPAAIDALRTSPDSATHATRTPLPVAVVSSRRSEVALVDAAGEESPLRALIADLLFETPSQPHTGLRVAQLVDSGAYPRAQVTATILDLAQRDIGAAGFRLRNPGAAAQTLFDDENPGADARAAVTAYRAVACDALPHRELQRALADWPTDAQRVSAFVADMAKEQDLASLRDLLLQMFAQDPGAAQEAVRQSMVAGLPKAEVERARVMLWALIHELPSVDAARTALRVASAVQRGNGERHFAVQHLGQSMFAALRGAPLGPDCTLDGAKLDPLVNDILGAAADDYQDAGVCEFTAVCLGALPDADQRAVRGLSHMLEQCTDDYLRMTALVNLGNVADLTTLRNVSGMMVDSAPKDFDAARQQYALLTTYLNVLNRHPEAVDAVAQEATKALSGWRYDVRYNMLRKSFLRMLRPSDPLVAYLRPTIEMLAGETDVSEVATLAGSLLAEK